MGCWLGGGCIFGLRRPNTGEDGAEKNTMGAERAVGEKRWDLLEQGSGDGLRDLQSQGFKLLDRTGEGKENFFILIMSGVGDRHCFGIGCLVLTLTCSALESFPPRMDQFWGLWGASAGLEVPSYTHKIRAPLSSACRKRMWT